MLLSCLASLRSMFLLTCDLRSSQSPCCLYDTSAHAAGTHATPSCSVSKCIQSCKAAAVAWIQIHHQRHSGKGFCSCTCNTTAAAAAALENLCCLCHRILHRSQRAATTSYSKHVACKFAAACHSSLLHLIVSAWQQQSVLLADLCPLTRPSKTPFIAASLMVQTLVCLTGFDANFSLQQGAREQHTVDPCRRAEVRTA